MIMLPGAGMNCWSRQSVWDGTGSSQRVADDHAPEAERSTTLTSDAPPPTRLTGAGLRCRLAGLLRRASSESRLATRDLTLAIATFIWTGLPCARYDRLIPFAFLILIGLFATLDAWSVQASHPCTIR